MTMPHAAQGLDFKPFVLASLPPTLGPGFRLDFPPGFPASLPPAPIVSLRAVSCRTLPPARAPECKSIFAGGQDVASDVAPETSEPLVQTSRISEVPDLGAPDPLAQARCRMVAEVVEELTMMVGDRPQLRRDRRRMMVHVRQIAMYVSHVVLQVTLTDIGIAFGRDRSTVSYSCHVVEDRRDAADFDDFVSTIERIIGAVFPPAAAVEQGVAP
ncbi:helix-turn-helix domain-containing protein [Rhizobium sp. Leaf371]|uniref:helix-turn-helix domain-containing protein n=1 Tax=Rhizobium sp. Leaf371 TaxID=1736355 RepID=UPI000A664744|nr:helix-turn-helix domain-containing protein [Rhizobium sp. Leaf371]